MATRPLPLPLPFRSCVVPILTVNPRIAYFDPVIQREPTILYCAVAFEPYPLNSQRHTKMQVVASNVTISRLLHILLCVLLSFQLAVADPAFTFLRSSKSESSSLAKSLLSTLLVRREKFIAQQGEWCPSGYCKDFTHQALRNTDPTQVLCGNSNRCAPIGYYCVKLTDEPLLLRLIICG